MLSVALQFQNHLLAFGSTPFFKFQHRTVTTQRKRTFKTYKQEIQSYKTYFSVELNFYKSENWELAKAADFEVFIL
ncbi:hypothetical protein L1887_36588 [Cichorium endivia]|nr:hypothetical protein L1887_36588 [Cichorium endivia]